MLAPFDGVQVDTLLHKLPQWAELAEECDSFLNCLDHIVDLAFGGESTNAKSDTAVGAFVTVSECTKYVARFKRGGSAGTAR